MALFWLLRMTDNSDNVTLLIVVGKFSFCASSSLTAALELVWI